MTTVTPTNAGIEVKALDSVKVAEIQKALYDARPQADGTKIIQLDFTDTTGTIPISIPFIGVMNSSDTECAAKCDGEISLAATVAVAAAKFGNRIATSSAMFRLTEEDKSIGKRRKSLTPNEKNALEVLGALSGGRKSRIKSFMLNGMKATAFEAKSLGLIDEVEGFVDRYAAERAKAKEDSKKKSEAKKEGK